MNPTPMQKFFALDWPAKIWMSIGPVICLLKAMQLAEITTWTVAAWKSELIMGICMLAAIPIGLFFSAISAFIILQPLYRARVRMNGGPFNVTDAVYVLDGPYQGRLGHVINHICHSGLTELPEQEVAVQFSDLTTESTQRVFSQVQLARASSVLQA